MSLITLQSVDNPAIIKNNFKDGIELKMGSEIGLVSLSINKIAVFEIIQGTNDTFTWRLGGRQSYNQHIVVVPEGEYTGDGLANILVVKLNESTVLGNFKGAWTATFDPTQNEGDGSFTINYGQNDTPTFNENTLTLYDGNANVSINNNSSTKIDVNGASMTNQFKERNNGSNIITGNKSIFPNDGEAIFQIKPIESFPLVQWVDRFINTGGIFHINELGIIRDFTITETLVGTPANTNGWNFEMNFSNGDPVVYMTLATDDEGLFGLSGDGTLDAEDPANWDTTLKYNETNGLLQDDTAGGRYTTTGANIGIKLSADPLGSSLDIIKLGTGYGNSKLGYVRNQLYNGRTNYPGNPDADILATQTSGFDLMFEVKDNVDFDGILVNLSQMIKTATPFPNPGWRNGSKYVFQQFTPTTWDQIPGTITPTVWANFNYGLDHIQVKYQISKIQTVRIFILHDTGGDQNFIEQVLIAESSKTTSFTKNIVEDFFPLRPCFTMINGGRYDTKTVFVGGKYDTEENVPPLGFTFTEQADVDLPLELEAGIPTNAVKLGALFIWGPILQSDLVSKGGTFPDADITPATMLTNTIAPIIGFNRFNVYIEGKTSNPTSSQQRPVLVIREPNLLLELVDFNIKGYNGATGDRGKIIASIPSEELNTNTRTGTLNYFSQYPIMIDMNLAHNTTVYDLNVILRRPNGKIADDLIPSTSMTLLLKEGEETKQKRLMKEQIELIASTMSNKNGSKINSIGMNNPLI